MKPLEFSRTIFIDRSLGGLRLPRLLRQVGFDVRVHKECDWFNSDEDDDIWIPDIARRGWVIVSSEKRISHDPINVNAVLQSKAQVVLASDNNKIPEFFGSAFIVGRIRVNELLQQNPGPVFIKMSNCNGEHVRVIQKHITHPRMSSPTDKGRKVRSPDFSFIKF